MMTTSPPAMASPSPSTTIWESAAVTSTGGSNSTTGSASRSSLIVTPSRAPGPSPPPSEPPPSEGPVPPSDPESSLQAAMPRAAVAARAVDSRERRRINAGAFRIGCPGGGARAPGYGLGPEELSGRRSGLGGSGHVYGPDLGEQGVDLGQGGREGVQDLHRHRAGPGQAQCGPVHDVIDAVLLAAVTTLPRRWARVVAGATVRAASMRSSVSTWGARPRRCRVWKMLCAGSMSWYASSRRCTAGSSRPIP